MPIGYSFKRLLLRGLIWDSEENQMTLATVLKDACRGKLMQTSRGMYLVSTSSNGASVEYQIPDSADGLSPKAIGEACLKLYDLYEAAIVELAAEDIEDPTNTQIQTRMLSMLKPTNRMRSDYSKAVTA